MRATLLKVVTVLALASALVAAQTKTPPDPAQMVQHHVNFLTKQLSLTTQQQQQATTIFTQAAATVQSAHEQMRTAHQNLQAAVQKNDTAAIDQITNSIATTMAQGMAAHAKAEAAFYQTLTPEQQTKMNELEAHHHGPGMHGTHGHGGPGGPPPGMF